MRRHLPTHVLFNATRVELNTQIILMALNFSFWLQVFNWRSSKSIHVYKRDINEDSFLCTSRESGLFITRAHGPAKLIKMCLNVFEVVCSPRIKEKLFDQFYFRETKQLNLDLCVCECGELYLWPQIKLCVSWRFRQSQCQHASIRASFFGSKPLEIEKFLCRKKLCSKKKEHKQGEGRSTVNAEVIFQHVTGFVYV